jgi:hypothetical protein
MIIRTLLIILGSVFDLMGIIATVVLLGSWIVLGYMIDRWIQNQRFIDNCTAEIKVCKKALRIALAVYLSEITMNKAADLIKTRSLEKTLNSKGGRHLLFSMLFGYREAGTYCLACSLVMMNPYP